MLYQFLFAFVLLALWSVYRIMGTRNNPSIAASLAALKHLWKKTFFGTFINGY